MRNYLIIIAVISVLVGCRTVKSEFEQKVSTVYVDSSVQRTEIVKSPPILHDLVFNEICDTVTGEANDFENEITIGPNTFKLTAENNRLKLQLAFKDSIRQKLIETHNKELRERDSATNKKITIYKVPPWAWWSLTGNVLSLMALGWYLKCKLAIF